MCTCIFCGKSFKRPGALAMHTKYCNSNPDKEVPKNEIKFCRYCNKICKNDNSLRNHERLCKNNPNRQILESNFIKWNKKRKELGIKGENHYTKAKRLNLPYPTVSDETRKKLSEKQKGHQLPDETKKKISDTQIRNLRGKHTNWLNNKKSYAESYFDNIFTTAVKQYRIGRYVVDYAWPDSKIYVEVDGEQHYTKNGLEHDKIRTENLEKLGWKCKLRIRWSSYKKLNYDEKHKLLLDNGLI